MLSDFKKIIFTVPENMNISNEQRVFKRYWKNEKKKCINKKRNNPFFWGISLKRFRNIDFDKAKAKKINKVVKRLALSIWSKFKDKNKMKEICPSTNR